MTVELTLRVTDLKKKAIVFCREKDIPFPIANYLVEFATEATKELQNVVYVKWIDSGYSLLADKWQDIEEVKALKDQIKPIETVGFLIDENDDYIVLVQTFAESENSVRGGYIIYKKNIIERKSFNYNGDNA